MPGERVQVRHGRLELTCTETYWRRESRHVSTGRSTTTQTSLVRHTERLALVSQSFLEEATLDRGLARDFEVALAIPQGAPPTVLGDKARIVWELRASLDVPRLRDVSREQEVALLARAPSRAAGQQSPVTAQSAFDQCSLALSVQPADINAGGSLAGTFSVVTREEVSFSEARVELERSERAGDASEEGTESRVVLAEGLSLTARQSREWPFALAVPSRLLPSVFASRTQVRWRIKGVLSRRLMPDFSVEQEVQVYTG